MIWDLLMEVKEKPEQYIGSPSLENLFVFLSGIIVYHWHLKDTGVVSLPGFREYICTKYKDPGLGFGYMQIICMNSSNDEEAFYRFYELLEEFVKLKGFEYIPFEGDESFERNSRSALECLWILLNETYEKWNIYIGEKTLRNLENFLNGAKSYCEKKEKIKLQILPGFDKYVKKLFKENGEMNFFRIIEKESIDSSHAFELFYELMFDYVKKMGNEYKPIDRY